MLPLLPSFPPLFRQFIIEYPERSSKIQIRILTSFLKTIHSEKKSQFISISNETSLTLPLQPYLLSFLRPFMTSLQCILLRKPNKCKATLPFFFLLFRMFFPVMPPNFFISPEFLIWCHLLECSLSESNPLLCFSYIIFLMLYD